MRKRDELSNPESCMSRARDDEWTFVLLGRDAAAPAAVRKWIEERIRLGKNRRDDPQIIEAEEWIEAVEIEQASKRRKHELDGNEARKIYREFWQLSVLTRKDGQSLCYCCEAPATGRSSMNIWGTIVDFETCDDCHKNVDLIWADSIPVKKPAPATH